MSTTYEIQITSHSSNIRSAPKVATNNIVGWAQNGETYTATKVQNGWYYITRKGISGWVYEGSKKEYVKLIKTNTVNTAPSSGQVNSNPPVQNNTTTTTTKPTTPNIQSSSKVTVVVPSTASIDDHAIVFSKDTQVSLSGIYKAKSNYIFKDQVTGYQYDGGIAYSNQMHANNYASKYLDKPTGKAYSEQFADIYGDISEAMNFIRETQDIFGIKDRDRLFSEFNRYKLAMPDNQATKTIPYIFFTKPIMNLVDGKGKLTLLAKDDPLWESMYADEPKNFFALDGEYGGYQHDFNCLLSNAAMSFQASDEVLKTVEHGETYTGWKMVYGRNTNESNTAGQFSIQYMDDHNYNIYKMHKIWVEYINRVYRGHIPGPNVKAKLHDNDIYRRFRSHIYKKVLTYPCAVYYIVCAADGETVLYWTKYYGVFPVNTPASVSSWTHGSPSGFPEFSINYVYSIKEDFHPITLSEFNRHSTADRIYRPLYNPDTHTNTPTMVGAPYIETQRTNGKLEYKLRFRN